MISGSFVLTDTISKAFDSIFTSAYDQDRRRRQRQEARRLLVERQRDGLAPTCSRRCGRCRDVAAAAPAIIDLNGDSTQAKLIDRDGKAIESTGNPTFGVGIDPSQPRFNPMHLTAGRWATGPRRGRDRRRDGREARPLRGRRLDRRRGARGRREPFRITGLAQYGDVASLGGATFAVFSLPTAQARAASCDGYSSDLGRREGRRRRRRGSSRELRQVVPGDGAGEDGATSRRRPTRRAIAGFLTFIRGFLLGVRRHRALRRLVRDLQHALDHRRAADARARDAADARRLAAAGAAARSCSSRSRSARSRRSSGCSPASGSRRGLSRAVLGARARPAGGLAGLRACGRWSSRCSSASASRVVGRRSARRSARRACRRSRPSARAPSPRGARSASRSRRGASSPLAARVARLRGALGGSLGSGAVAARARRRRRCCCSSASRGSRRGSSARSPAVVGLPARRLGGAAGRLASRERGPQPGPHGRDGGGADDRARARLVRRRARQGRARLDRPTRSRSRCTPTGSSPRRTAGRASRSRRGDAVGEGAPGARVTSACAATAA